MTARIFFLFVARSQAVLSILRQVVAREMIDSTTRPRNSGVKWCKVLSVNGLICASVLVIVFTGISQIERRISDYEGLRADINIKR